MNTQSFLEDDDEAVVVTCCQCKAEFEGFAPEQANDCAADWDPSDRTLTGHYGSAVIDMEQWVAEESTPLPATAGQVCDPCISQLIEDGVITRSAAHEGPPLHPTPHIAEMLEAGVIDLDAAPEQAADPEDTV